jgi:tRNA(fMet)-specific endonuclease VapC
MNGYALDANIVSFRMKDHKAVTRRLDKANKNEWNVQIPPFAYYEVKRGLLAIKASARLRQLASLREAYPVGRNDDRVFEEAAVIWADLSNKGWNIDDMDIFIAAWCRVNGFTLVTNNTAHFAPIPGLALEDWSV